MHSRNIFIDYPNINHIPVVDNENNILDIMSRERAFWKQYYRENKLPRMHYAFAMWNAAFEAKSLGYKEVTVIEFGVAGGSGLLNCEFHAKAISKILDIEIHIYGFDSSNGLPMKNAGYKDMIHIWPGGSYGMNYEELINKLQFSELIIGDINETGKKFFETFNYGPIGCMLIDVDYYSSTLPILDMLNSSDEFFLPRVYMYFDDIAAEYEFSGENLAVSEFNKSHENIKISPEKLSYPDYRMKIKTCHRFNHPKYNDFVTIFLGLELPSDAYELRLKDSL